MEGGNLGAVAGTTGHSFFYFCHVFVRVQVTVGCWYRLSLPYQLSPT